MLMLGCAAAWIKIGYSLRDIQVTKCVVQGKIGKWFNGLQ